MRLFVTACPPKTTCSKEGDIVNVDCSTIVDGYFSDSSRMFCIGEVSEERKRLVEVTREAMLKGLEQVKPWPPGDRRRCREGAC